MVLEDQRPRTRANEAAAERLRLGRFDAPRLLPSSLALLLGVVALAAAVGFYWVARETALFEIRRIEVVGAPPAVGARVSAALRPLEGESLVELERSDLDRRVAGLSDVVGVTHDRAFPHTLRVFVRSERPLLVLRRGGESWLVSERARVVRPLPKGTRAALPRVWVPRTVDVEVGDTIADTTARAAVRVLSLARFELPGRVRAVRIERGEAALILRSGVEVRLGRGHDLPLKLAVAADVLPELTRENGYVDVAVPSRPVAGPER